MVLVRMTSVRYITETEKGNYNDKGNIGVTRRVQKENQRLLILER